MASKELVDQYVFELGVLYTMHINKFFREQCSEEEFLSNLIVCPYDDNFSPDLGDARHAMHHFNDFLGDKIESELIGVSIGRNFVQNYSFNIFPNFLNGFGDMVHFVVSEKCELDDVTYQFLIDEISDEVLLEEIGEIKLKQIKV